MLNSNFEKHQTEQNVCTSSTFTYAAWPCYQRRGYLLAEEYAKMAERTDVSMRSLDNSLHMRHASNDFQIFHGSCTKCSIFIWCVLHRNQCDRCNFIYKTEQTSKRFCQTVTLQKNQSRSIFPKESKCPGELLKL